MITRVCKFCINCEEPISSELADDFCSAECAAEFISGADSAILERETNSNPNALTVGQQRTITGMDQMIKNQESKHGILPPNSLDAITALLQTSSTQSIKDAVKHLTPNSQNETEPE
ncbi:MAG TPA: hypothetical protein VGF75_02620 [Candidatus Saccharimonadales bacterium]|jgi:hypothetical protein